MVSIIIPAFDSAAYIAECLTSIQRQTYEDIEVIVIDDGSRDATREVALEIVSGDSRFSVVSRRHENAGVARNVGLSRARGDYLLFFDADDRMSPTMVEQLVRRAEQTHADVVCCRSRSFVDGEEGFLDDDNGPYLDDFSRVCSGRDLGDELLLTFVGWAWDKLFLTSFVSHHGLRFQSLTSTNDAYFVYCALALAERIALVDEALPEHRKHAGSIERSRQLHPHNARLAYEAIAERLAGEPVWDSVKASLMSWGIIHLRWNFTTLDPPAQRAAFEDYRHLLAEAAAMPGKPDFEEDRMIASALASAQERGSGAVIGEQALALTGVMREVRRLNGVCEAQAREVRKLTDALDAVRGSVSFRAGRALTAAPRALRDALRRR